MNLATVERTKSEEERASKSQEGREIETISWSSNDKTKIGEYMSSRPPKKPGGEEVDDTNSAKTITCYTSSDHENSDKTVTDMLGKMKVPNTVRMEKETNRDKKGPLPWDDLWGMTLASLINVKTKGTRRRTK